MFRVAHCAIEPFRKVRGLVGSATLRVEKLVQIGLGGEFVRTLASGRCCFSPGDPQRGRDCTETHPSKVGSRYWCTAPSTAGGKAAGVYPGGRPGVCWKRIVYEDMGALGDGRGLRRFEATLSFRLCLIPARAGIQHAQEDLDSRSTLSGLQVGPAVSQKCRCYFYLRRMSRRDRG